MKKIKQWCAKGHCPICNVGTGSRHRVSCPNKYLTSTQVKNGDGGTAVYGSAGFETLMFKGKPLNFKEGDNLTQVVTIDHVYQGLAPFSANEAKLKRHSCLRFGYWCWKDAFEHPLDAIALIKYRLTHRNYPDVHNKTSRD